MTLIIKTEAYTTALTLVMNSKGPHLILQDVGVSGRPLEYNLVSSFEAHNLEAVTQHKDFKDKPLFAEVLTHTVNDVKGLQDIVRAERLTIDTIVRRLSLVFIEASSGSVSVFFGVNWVDDEDLGLTITHNDHVNRWTASLQERGGEPKILSVKGTLLSELVELTSTQIRETFGL